MIQRQFLKITPNSITVDLWFFIFFWVYKELSFSAFGTEFKLLPGVVIFNHKYGQFPNLAAPEALWVKTKLSDHLYNVEEQILAAWRIK